jgi:hypothetical protein
MPARFQVFTPLLNAVSHDILRPDCIGSEVNDMKLMELKVDNLEQRVAPGGLDIGIGIGVGVGIGVGGGTQSGGSDASGSGSESHGSDGTGSC